ncbi:hypothetical protein OKA05_26990 [Luteolibacter arcticus]|uniref:Uncharacterized protein n=1 Tax=Luteolibacter arcticus TaxID=1581411 RepID=A0ABT3GRS8_9BACT|nr:hypothetical protein [Luteolibacter arcticus]MCW1926233.1 hypothetical protein [Luteolibacter arcticus]
MSKRVIFTCTLLMILGLWGSYDTISHYLQGGVNINLFGLFLPVLVLLFLGLPGARAVATGVFTVSYLTIVVAIVGATSFRSQVPAAETSLLSQPSMVALIGMLLGAPLMLLHWMLFSPPFEEHLGRRRASGGLPPEISE